MTNNERTKEAILALIQLITAASSDMSFDELYDIKERPITDAASDVLNGIFND